MDFIYKKVTLAEARFALNGSPAERENWEKLRLAQQPEKLLDSAARWIMAFPQAMRPLELAKLYPRIANKICKLRGQPEALQLYIQDLLCIQRDDQVRHGFPARVVSELNTLSRALSITLTTNPIARQSVRYISRSTHEK